MTYYTQFTIPLWQTDNDMIDLKNAKPEDFTVVEAPKHDMSRKVRCTFRRAVSGSYTPKTDQCHITKLPEKLYNEFFSKGV